MSESRTLPGSTGLAIEHLSVNVPVDSVQLEGTLSVPTAASGVVLFAHGSGSSRHSPRNRYVADLLNENGLATVLIDLLTADEQEVDLQTGQLRFDIPLLAKRLVAITEWLARHPEVNGLEIGHFGASTGAGAALMAAAEIPALVRAVVSRGGRPDLAGRALGRVKAPTLFIVGGVDRVVLDLNRQAKDQMHCEKRLEVISGASHLFEEKGALKKVAGLAGDWFAAKLRRGT
ncbi:MAG TPA: dienelactone hydrolase family protein [Bryobacteraceae bacterium]|nr:dienelactone hydrolase family protein [Bryobacteraceae bacterium]